MKITKLDTCVIITYKKNGNINSCKSIYENSECYKPLIKTIKSLNQ